MPEQFQYSKLIPAIAAEDVRHVIKKDEEYGASWLEYGGVSAFFATVRKWDRMRVQLKKHNYDVFAAYADGLTSEQFTDTVGDMRRYLFLWEARAQELGIIRVSPPVEGNWLRGLSLDTDQGQDPGEEKKLLNDLLHILGNHCGERGKSEGAVETLRRVIMERDRAVAVAGEAALLQPVSETPGKIPCARCETTGWLWRKDGWCSNCVTHEEAHPMAKVSRG